MARRPRLGLPFAIVLAIAWLPAGCGIGTACPAALLTGDLVRQGDELVVVNANGASAPAERIQWPGGHRVENRDGRLAIVDLFGTVKAGEGDWIRLGGGESEPGTWAVCGLLESDPMPP